MLAERLKNLRPSGIRKIFDLVEQIENPVNLSIGTSDFDVPEEIKEEAIRWMKAGGNQYTSTQGLPELREALREHLRAQDVHFDDVVVTSGVTGGFVLSIMALVNPGDEVLIPDPRFVMYSFVVELMGGISKFVDTYPDFHLKEEQIRQQITPKTKAIVINNPNNPTGVVYTAAELQMVARVAEEHSLYIIADEIYEKFLFDNLPFFSVAHYYPRTIILRGFAKSWAMSGWRIGYLAAPTEIIEAITKLQHYTFICVAPFIQKAALKALEFNGEHLIRQAQEKRDLVYHGLKDLLEVQKPQGSFYIFPRAPQGDGEGFVKQALQNKLLVVPGSAFSQKSTHFRISFAASKVQLLKALELIQQLVKLQ